MTASRGRIIGLLLFAGVFSRPAIGDPLKAFSGDPEEVGLEDLLPHADAPENRGNRFYSEWWSVVFRLEGGYNAYVQFLVTNMGVEEGRAAVTAEFKQPGKDRIRNRFETDRKGWSAASDRFELSFGPNRMSGPVDALVLHLENESFQAEFRLANLFPPWKPGSGRAQYGRSARRYWMFHLPAPAARVEGTVVVKEDGSRHEVRGLAQVEHQVLSIGTHEQARRMARFRQIGDREVFLFRDVETPPEYDGAPIRFLVFFRDGKVAFQSLAPEVRTSDFYTDPDREGYQAPRLLEFRSAGGDLRLRGAIKAVRMTGREDFLEDSSTMVRFVVGKFAKPIQYYFDGTFALEVSGPDGQKKETRGKGSYYFTVVNP